MINNWLFKSCDLSTYINNHEDHGKSQSNKLIFWKVSKLKLCVGNHCSFIYNVTCYQGDIKNDVFIPTTLPELIFVIYKIEDFNNEAILHKI